MAWDLELTSEVGAVSPSLRVCTDSGLKASELSCIAGCPVGVRFIREVRWEKTARVWCQELKPQCLITDNTLSHLLSSLSPDP